MRIITFNVNGLRAIAQKTNLKGGGYGFAEFAAEYEPDVICLQETKLQEGQAVNPAQEQGYEGYFNCAERKGYSGTAALYRTKPIKIWSEFDYGDVKSGDLAGEGRVITMEFDDFFLICEYTPNYGRELETNTRGNHLPERVGFRMAWEERRLEYALALDKVKPIILCGDLNVAHEEIDLKNPKSNRKNAGFTDEERAKMTTFLGAGFADIYRRKYPGKADAYTWWSYRFNARKNNSGWRIDYFICSERLYGKVKNIEILSDVYGSDHCPVMLDV
jgi:exodeoxyribonuclease-3